MSTLSFLETAITRSGEKMVTKWAHYFEIYERELARFRQQPVTFLEIGIFRGGSVPMWKEYFHPESRLVFVDIDPACKDHQIEGTVVEIGDQSDPDFLQRLSETHGPFDIVLDDGSHVSAHQIKTFNALWPSLSHLGIYMVEDCHTSYWPGFGGGYRNEASFIEYAKRTVDRMHSWYTDQDDLFAFDELAHTLLSTRFYDSIVVFEKAARKDVPLSLTIANGEARGSRRALEVRGRTSIFAGKDGGR